MSKIAAAIRNEKGGVRFTVRLTPKGGRDRIEGWRAAADGKLHLKVRVSAPPEAGKANRALISLLAKTLDVAKSRIAIVGGETARLKQVDAEGSPDYLRAKLEALGVAP